MTNDLLRCSNADFVLAKVRSMVENYLNSIYNSDNYHNGVRLIQLTDILYNQTEGIMVFLTFNPRYTMHIGNLSNSLCYLKNRLREAFNVPVTIRTSSDGVYPSERYSEPTRQDTPESYTPKMKPNYEERKTEEMRVPNVVKIVHRTSKRGEFFTVYWDDDTQTSVKRMEGEVSDDYTAFMFALGKKLFKNKGIARQFIAQKKQVFENEVARKQEKIKKQRAQQAMKQHYESMTEDYDIQDEVYDGMFVAPCLVSKKLFKKNGGMF